MASDGGVDRAVRGLHDDGRRAGLLRDAPQHLHAVHAGHDEVEQHEGDGAMIRAFQDVQGLLAALGGLGLVAETLDGFFEDAALGGIVVDDQDELGHWAGYSTQLLLTQERAALATQDRTGGHAWLTRQLQSARDG